MSERDILLVTLQKKSPAERSAYLDQSCAGDAALRRRLEALLQAFDPAGHVIEDRAVDRPASGASAPNPESAPPDHGTVEEVAPRPKSEGPGSRIGPYKLLQKLGEGGMGGVYLVEQEHPVRRRAALKIIKAGMDSAQVIARFEQERQALAMMDHPNIAKVLDGGATDTGRPYFVMELVKGIPITKFCDQEHLTPQQRLELFIPVCQAVQHAHQKGIIHRDLKPSNVLIALYDSQPVPKVIDFGVAKATSQKLTERTMFTEVGSIVGTVEYMAPEQAELNNLDIDTRADIYSLGVILYELLTGSPPFTSKQLRSAAYPEMLRLIREIEPPKPSTKLSSSEDLPAIAARRKLEPRTLKKLVHGDLDWIVMKALEKDRGRRYETANGLAMDLQRYLHDEPVLAGPPSTGYRLRKFVRRNRGQVLAAGLLLLALLAGLAGTGWGLVEARRQRQEATEQRDRAFAAEEQAKEEERKAKASAAEARAVLEFFQDRVLAAARPAGQEGGLGRDVTIRKAVDAAEPGILSSFRDQPLVEASIREVLGTTYWYLGEAALAIRQHEQVLETRKAKLGRDHAQTLASMNLLAIAYHSLGQLDRAIALHEQALEIRKAKPGLDDPGTLTSMNNLATAYKQAGKLDRAISLLEQTLKSRQATLGLDHPYTLTTMNNLANAYHEAGQLGRAISLNERTLETRKAKLGSDHPDTLTSMNNLATAYHDSGQLDRAIFLHEQTLQTRKAKLGSDHPDTLTSINNLAALYYTVGKLDQALPLYVQTLEIRKAKLGLYHPDTLTSMNNLANAYLSSGQVDRGITLHEQTLETRKAKLGTDHPDTLTSMNNLAGAYEKRGQHPGGEALRREALALQRKKVGEAPPRIAYTLAGLGLNLLRQTKDAEAEPLLRECLTIREQKLPDDWSTYDTKSLLGGSLLGQKKYAEAEPLLLAGFEGMKQREVKISAHKKVRLTETQEWLVQLYDGLGKKDKADEWRKKLEDTKTAAHPPAKP